MFPGRAMHKQTRRLLSPGKSLMEGRKSGRTTNNSLSPTPVLSSSNEIGTALYHEAFEVHQTALAARAKKGSAAGGMAKEDVNSSIFNKLTE